MKYAVSFKCCDFHISIHPTETEQVEQVCFIFKEMCTGSCIESHIYRFERIGVYIYPDVLLSRLRVYDIKYISAD